MCGVGEFAALFSLPHLSLISQFKLHTVKDKELVLSLSSSLSPAQGIGHSVLILFILYLLCAVHSSALLW